MTREFIDNLWGKSKRTLKREQQALYDRQAELREELLGLKEQRKKLRIKNYKLLNLEKRDAKKEELVSKMLSDIEKDIKELLEEHERNSKILSAYSEVIKNKEEGKGVFWRTLFAGGAMGGSMYLGKKALDKAYQSDIEGTLVNKKTLDIFNKFDLLKRFTNFKIW